jgi:formylglycine-generating enzyme required for sulfatase activity
LPRRLAAALLAAAALPALAALPRVAVLDVRAVQGVQPGTATLLTMVIAGDTAKAGYDVLAQADIGTMIGFESQKKMLGCGADSNCLAEIGGALGTEYVLASQVGQLGSRYLLSLQLIESRKGIIVGRASTFCERTEDALADAAQASVAEVLAQAKGRSGPAVAQGPKATPAARASAKPAGETAATTASSPPPREVPPAAGAVAPAATEAAARPVAAEVASPRAGPVAMVALAGGTFRAGERTGQRRDTWEYHSVGDFALDATEVTVEAYAECVRAGACTPAGDTVRWDGARPVDVERWSGLCNARRAGTARHPVNCVDWWQANAYCKWIGKRLPSEKEWEWAARGGAAGTPFPWGNEVPSGRACWSGASSPGSTCPVGAHPRGQTASGVQDLAGNVWEWTSSDEYAPTGVNASGAVRGKVIRGGGWLDAEASRLAASVRLVAEEGRRGVDLGFRCAKEL